jgi:hypothetical protein
MVSGRMALAVVLVCLLRHALGSTVMSYQTLTAAHTATSTSPTVSFCNAVAEIVTLPAAAGMGENSDATEFR